MIPRIIHQTVRNVNELTWEEKRLTKLSLKNLPQWEYHIWDDEQNASIVKTYFPQYWDQYNRIGKGVAKADIARYMYMAIYGGFYFDTDYKIIKEVPADILSENCVLPISRKDFRLGNGVLASMPKHQFWYDLLEDIFADERLNNLKENQIEKTTGPEKVTDFYLRNKSKYTDLCLPEKEIFHPNIVCKGFIPLLKKETIGVHFCWGSWRSKSNIFSAMINLLRRKVQAL